MRIAQTRAGMVALFRHGEEWRMAEWSDEPTTT